MPIFTRTGDDQMPPRPELVSPDSNLSIISTGMKIVGDIETDSIVKIDGTVEGSIRAAKQLLLGPNGTIHGDVHAQEASLGGRIIGSVNTTQRVEIQSTCVIQGDVQTKSIVVLEGGVINGTVRMDAAPVQSTQSLAKGALAISQ